LIEFKWERYGRRHHFIGCFLHLLYIAIFTLYVRFAYIVEAQYDARVVYVILLFVGILYQTLYDLMQAGKVGFGYLANPYNYSDLAYVYGSIANGILQITMGPAHISSKIVMCIIVVLLITKTFFFLRIFPSLTPIVVMLSEVIFDLKVFLFFYAILILLFS